MNAADKRYARERVEQIARDVKMKYKSEIPYVQNPNGNRGSNFYLTNEHILAGLQCGAIRVPSQKEAVDCFKKTSNGGNWHINFLIGYKDYEKVVKAKMQEDYDAYVKSTAKYNDFYRLVDQETLKIVDEIMLSKECNLSKLTERLMSMKFEEPRSIPVRKRK